MDKKSCFVIMGFGKKRDIERNREINLDLVYEEIIKKAVEENFASEYNVFRSDSILSTGLIDKRIFELLAEVDLVIADITTLNPNAIYELGIRHTLKPYSTIIMIEENYDIPFDINHLKVIKYSEINEDTSITEKNKLKNILKEYIENTKKNETDSPIHAFCTIDINHNKSREVEKILEDKKSEEETIKIITEKIKNLKKESKFKELKKEYKKLLKYSPNDSYIIQQLAISIYKSRLPNETEALGEAYIEITKLRPETSVDSETLGIAGSIQKRLYKLNKYINLDYINKAIRFYEKGYVINRDNYTGGNYVECMILKALNDTIRDDEKHTLNYLIKEKAKEVIEISNNLLDNNGDDVWIYSTLTAMYLILEEKENYTKSLEKVQQLLKEEWQIKTLEETLEVIREYSKL